MPRVGPGEEAQRVTRLFFSQAISLQSPNVSKKGRARISRLHLPHRRAARRGSACAKKAEAREREASCRE